MPPFPRAPSYSAVNQTELGSFQKFLERPSPSKLKRLAKKNQDMSGYASSKDSKWEELGWKILEVFLAETVGTGMLLFFGCMGSVVFLPSARLPDLQGAIVFAVVIATIVQIFGHISAAHINPAVTIAFMVLGQVSPGMAVVYIISEIFGAVLGYGLLVLLTPPDVMALNMVEGGLCCTVPHEDLTSLQALAMEFFATCFLVMVVCACSDPRNADKADSAPLKFGCVILALSICLGPYTGGSMNPVRSFGPAVWTGVWTRHWVYWLGTCLSGLFTAIFYQAIFNRRQSSDTTVQDEESLNQVKVGLHRSLFTEQDRSIR